jgi:hypothetical protein
MIDYSEWLSTSQVARRLQLSGQHVQDLGDAGKLRCIRTAIGRLYDPQAVDALAQQRAARQRAKETADAGAR